MKTDGPQRRRTGAMLRIAALFAALGVAGATAYVAALHADGGAPAGRRWLAHGMASKVSLVCWVVILACIAVLLVLGLAMWRSGLAQRRARKAAATDSQDGTAMLEFAMVLPIALFLVLVMIQSTLLMAGNLCVHYAAYCATRTAIVAIPDGPRQPDTQAPPLPEGPNVLESLGYSLDQGGSDKAQRIWKAAVYAVTPVSGSSPNMPADDPAGLADGLRRFYADYGKDTPWWARDTIARKLNYAQRYTSVRVAAPGGEKYLPNQDVTVRVEHTLYLSIPFAARLFAQLPGGQLLDFGAGEYGTVVGATCTLSNEGVQDFIEQEPYTGR